MSVDSLKTFLNMGFTLGKVIVALEDGFQLSDLGPVLAAAKAIPGGLAAAKDALNNYLTMDDSEALPLEEWVTTQFKVPDAGVEAAVQTALKVVIELHGLAHLLAPKGV